MEELSLLSVSPEKLRFNYTLASKSTKSTRSKKEYHHNHEDTSEIQSRRVSLSPKKASTLLISSEMARLEEELDREEISLKLYEIQEISDESKKLAEVSIYEKYIDNLLQCVVKSDHRLGKSLVRGWKGYQKSLQKPVRSPVMSESKKKENFQKEIGIQCSDILLDPHSAIDLEEYINCLHNVISGMNHMHTNRIINKLHDLSKSLKTVEVPSPSSSPEPDGLDFTDTLKSIHTKLKASLRPKPNTNYLETVPKETKHKESQTIYKLEDFKQIENLKVIVFKNEATISELNGKLRRTNEIEELLTRKNKEIEELKGQIQDIQNTPCPQCFLKNQKIANDNAEIRGLQLSVHKSINMEKELQLTKSKLKETISTLTVQNSKILELTVNVNTLSKKVVETEAEKEILVEKLHNEQDLRVKVETQLHKEIQQVNHLKKVIINKATPKPEIEIEEIDLPINDKSTGMYTSPNKTIIKKPIDSPYLQGLLNEKTFTSYTPTDANENSFTSSPETKKLLRIREKFKNNMVDRGQSAPRLARIDKGNQIMRVLNMTKDEYLSLSKKARIELFECLFEHKERCGADCEHLKRAMLIRFKDKGPLFPTKKYNIS